MKTLVIFGIIIFKGSGCLTVKIQVCVDVRLHSAVFCFRKAKVCRVMGIVANSATEVEESVNLTEVTSALLLFHIASPLL